MCWHLDLKTSVKCGHRVMSCPASAANVSANCALASDPPAVTSCMDPVPSVCGATSVSREIQSRTPVDTIRATCYKRTTIVEP